MHDRPIVNNGAGTEHRLIPTAFKVYWSSSQFKTKRMRKMCTCDINLVLTYSFQTNPIGCPLQVLLSLRKKGRARLSIVNVSSELCKVAFGVFKPEPTIEIRTCIDGFESVDNEPVRNVHIQGRTTLRIPPKMMMDFDGTFLLKWIPEGLLRDGQKLNFMLKVDGKAHSTNALVLFDLD